MEDNKLIAEFMGMNYGDPNDNSVMIQMTPQGNEVVPINSMEYHTSWEWLMPVLEKILDITFSDDEKETSDSEYFYNIRDCVPDINHTYKAVVEFIKTI